MRKRKGFTMVELVVVIIIMAILGLAVMPSLIGSSEKAKYSRAWNDLNAISNAFTAFYGRVGNLPSITSADLGSGSVSGSVTDLSGASLDAKDLLQSFLGTPLANLKDPCGAPYK
ncbi:MAG: type II secretion system protein, partial [Acetomicrobium sp.]